ncbi:MAG: 50S ribosomal protein L11 methyltransferase [Bacillota bacterium]|jgi:ribosomal protein L11 methyltransferase
MKGRSLCLVIEAPDFMEDVISYLLWQRGCSGVMIEDPRLIKKKLADHVWEASVFDEKSVITGRIAIKSWFKNDQQGKDNMQKIREDLTSLISIWKITEKDISVIEYSELEVDWLAEFKKGFSGRLIGEKIVIKPTWEKWQADEGQVVIEMDPGMAFGSGDHSTTSLCLQALEKYWQKSAKVADIGCGSAILAIAAALLGAKEVIALDNDDAAVKVALENVKLNRVEGIVRVTKGNLADNLTGKYDIILANIVADPIIKLLPQVKKLLSPAGVFICSGILTARAGEVEKAIAVHELSICEKWHDGCWYAAAVRQKIG